MNKLFGWLTSGCVTCSQFIMAFLGAILAIGTVNKIFALPKVNPTEIFTDVMAGIVLWGFIVAIRYSLNPL